MALGEKTTTADRLTASNVIYPSLIFWDWNGTLLDDVSASLAAVNDMLARRGRNAIDIERYRAAIGVPIRRFYDIHFDMTQEDYTGILREYGEWYMHHLPKCGLADGAAELLKHLRNSGVLQVILSSGEQSRVEASLKAYGVAQYFNAVLEASDYLAGSKLDRAREYLQALKISPDKVLITGDLVHDFEVAFKLGTRCVLVDWGHQGTAQFSGLDVKVASKLKDIFVC